MLGLCRQPCTSSWLQCVAGLQSLHNAAVAAAGLGLLPACPAQQHQQHQQGVLHRSPGCRGLFTQQQHQQQREQTPPGHGQQSRLSTTIPEQSDADSVSGVRSLIHKQRLQLPRAAVPSLEQELQQLRERQEQHLLQAVAQRARRAEQRQPHGRSRDTHVRQQDDRDARQWVDANAFAQLGVARPLVRSLIESGIHTPTPVQVRQQLEPQLLTGLCPHEAAATHADCCRHLLKVPLNRACPAVVAARSTPSRLS